MSVDPHGYPWPDTPPMTTPPDDPRADEGLVEAMAEAATAAQGWRWHDIRQMIDVEHGAVCSRNRQSWRKSIRSALTAARSHGGM